MANRAVIIGSGAAAYECVAELTNQGYTGEIHVFSDTARAPYNPMLTTYYASGKLPYEGMFPYGDDVENGVDFWAQQGATFHAKDPITALDAQGKTITTQSGLTLAFTHCLIASGATPVVPPVPGYQSKRIYTVRTVEDAQRLAEVAHTNPKRVIVVGASMVGVKVVELFLKVGAKVCFADMAPRIFSLAAHPDCSAEIEQRMIEKGVEFRFGAGWSGVEDLEDGVRLNFGDDAPSEEADVAVICVGVRANLGFVNREQIEVGRGILIDDHMQTSVPGIYAAGDVSQGWELLGKQQQIIGLWANARMQGRTAGRNMAGVATTYEGNILHNITHFMDMDFVGLGQISGYTHMDTIKTETGLSLFFWKDEQLIGANFLDRYLNCGTLRAALVAGEVIKPAQDDGWECKTEHARILHELLQVDAMG